MIERRKSARAERRRRDAEYAVTRALIDSDSAEDAVRRVLAAIGETLEWEVGAYWEVDPQRAQLVCREVWHTDPAQAERYAALNRQFAFSRGVGLPGRVWESGSVVWIEDVRSDANFPRSEVAERYDLKGGVAFPVFSGHDLIGVIEFLATTRVAPSEAYLRMLAGIGSEVGLYIRRAQIERDLRESELRFRALSETASDAIITIGGDSVIRYVNPATERLFGYAAADLVGRKLTELMPASMRRAHTEGLTRYLRSGKRNIPWSGVQLPALHQSGREFPVEISFGEYVLGSEHVFTGIVRDITERVRQQDLIAATTAKLQATVAQLEERTAEAEAAARAKSDFLAAMSHELRTPLQAVIGYAGLLDAGVHGGLNEEQRAPVERIQASAEHLLGLIDQVLDVARAETGRLDLRLEPVNLCNLVAEAVELVRPQAEQKDLALVIGPCTDKRLLAVEADRGRVRQIVLNLLSNAVKFTRAGTITVNFEAVEQRARIAVSDTGPGIPAGQLDHVFEKFYQTEVGLSQRQPGMGLGLSISRDLARTMGGDIEARSVVGAGSTFTLLLPLRGSAQDEQAGNGEVNDQPHHVDQGGDHGGGRAGRVEADAPKHEGQH